MADQQIRYIVTSVTDGFAAGMQRVQQALGGLKGHTEGAASTFRGLAQSMSQHMAAAGQGITAEVTAMGGHFSGLLEAVGATRGGFVALGAAAAALAAGKAVAATAQMTESAMDLARVLGSSTNEAQAWRLALEDVGASQGELEGAAKGMARTLKENEDAMRAMGLQTRDAHGNLRPMTELLADGIDLLGGYREGADRALASQALFGKGIDASSKLLLLNTEAISGARDMAAELGLEVGDNAVQAWKAYDAATDRAAFSLRGLGNTAGTILMPVITQLVEIFNAAMPAALVVTRGAIGGLTTGFHALTNGVVVVWETIKAMIFTVTEPIRSLGSSLYKLASGDFKGATEEMMGWTDRVGEVWSTAMDTMVASSESAKAKIAAIWGGGDSAPGTPEGPRGTRGYTAPPKAGKADGSASALDLSATFENMLSEARAAAAELDAIHGMSKAQELAFWQEILQTYPLTEAEKTKVARKAQEARIALLREEAQAAQQINRASLATWESTALARVQIDQDLYQTMEAAGSISKAQLLEQELEFERRRQAIRQTSLQQQLQALDPQRDPVQVAQLQSQLEQLEMQHQVKLLQIRGQQQRQGAAEMQQIWADLGNTLSGLWDKGIGAMMNGTLTWRNATKAVFADMAKWFAEATVGGMVKEWLKAQAKKLQAVFATTAGEKAAQVGASQAVVGAKTAEASTVIAANAAEAGAGAAASQAAIPVVGPGLAMAAMAAVFAGVLALRGKFSAAGGFDIPSGVNPLTQLHEREMVLPAHIADPLRQQLAGGGLGGGRGGDITVQVRGASAGEFLMMHKSELVKALKSARRDGYSFA